MKQKIHTNGNTRNLQLRLYYSTELQKKLYKTKQTQR